MEAEERVLRVVEEIVELDKALGSLFEHKVGMEQIPARIYEAAR